MSNTKVTQTGPLRLQAYPVDSWYFVVIMGNGETSEDGFVIPCQRTNGENEEMLHLEGEVSYSLDGLGKERRLHFEGDYRPNPNKYPKDARVIRSTDFANLILELKE